MSDAERKELNLKAGKLIESCGISIGVEDSFDVLREKYTKERYSNIKYIGFAHYYLKKCYDKSELVNKADIRVVKELLKIDSKLGLAKTEQLFAILDSSVRMDLIKVRHIFHF